MVKRILFAVVVVILTAAPSVAGDLKLPSVAFLVAQAADLHSTHIAISSGRAVEGNPIMDVGNGGRIAIKAAMSAGVLWGAHRIERSGRPRAAKVLLYSVTAIASGIAARNYRIGVR